MITDRDTGQSKGFAFVEMATDQEAQAATQAMNGKTLDGRQIKVNEAKPRESRSGGGGGGGGVVVAAVTAAVAVAAATAGATRRLFSRLVICPSRGCLAAARFVLPTLPCAALERYAQTKLQVPRQA